MKFVAIIGALVLGFQPGRAGDSATLPAEDEESLLIQVRKNAGVREHVEQPDVRVDVKWPRDGGSADGPGEELQETPGGVLAPMEPPEAEHGLDDHTGPDPAELDEDGEDEEITEQSLLEVSEHEEITHQTLADLHARLNANSSGIGDHCTWAQGTRRRSGEASCSGRRRTWCHCNGGGYWCWCDAGDLWEGSVGGMPWSYYKDGFCTGRQDNYAKCGSNCVCADCKIKNVAHDCRPKSVGGCCYGSVSEFKKSRTGLGMYAATTGGPYWR